MPALRRFFSPRLPWRLNSPTAPSAAELFRAQIHSSTAADRQHAGCFQVQPSSHFNYRMASQEVMVVSQKSVQVAVAQKENLNPKAGKERSVQPRRKSRKAKLAAPIVTETGAQVQTIETKTKTKKTKKTKKQKRAEIEAAAEVAKTAKAAEASNRDQVIQITEEITESQAEENPLIQDQVTVPSAASGGVPEPTAAYLRCANLPPSRLARPRRILIVMDLNGTLLHRPDKRRPSHFVERQHARLFMDYLLSTFYVAVWSSARPHNVHNMVNSLLTPRQRQLCLVIWGRDRFGLSTADYDSRVQCYKRLTRLWADRAVVAAARVPGDSTGSGFWDQSNTVLVDDSTEKARSEPHNLLRIPEYGGPASEMPLVLPQVHDYINELSYQADISRYMRENPFKLDADYKLQSDGKETVVSK